MSALPEPIPPEREPLPMLTRCLADVRPEPVRWLWPGRIACGKVTMLAGNPGLGKSQITASLAATVTTGGLWPVDRTRAERGAAVFLNAEDDAGDTLVPRLTAAGADLTLCHVIDAVNIADREGLPRQRGFALSRDVSALTETLASFGNVKLLVIDPVSAYLGAVDSHRNAEVRALLAPLSDMAARLGVAVVCVSHLNKGGGTDALARVTGSLAFVAAARAAWIVARDPQDPERRLFLPAKNNIGPDASGLAFGIEPVTLDDGIETSRLAWHTEPVSVTASEALAADGGQDRRSEAPQSAEAEAWLAEALAVGPVATETLRQRARADGIAWRTVERAKTALDVRARRHGFGESGRWAWELPPGSIDRQGSHRPPRFSDVGGLSENVALAPFSGDDTPKTATIPGVGGLCAKTATARHTPPTTETLAVYGAETGENPATMRVSPKTANHENPWRSMGDEESLGGLWEDEL
jgi:hypothetical protein